MMILLESALTAALLAFGVALLWKHHTYVDEMLGGGLLSVGGALLSTLTFDDGFADLVGGTWPTAVALILGSVLAIVGATIVYLRRQSYRQMCRDLEQRI